MDDLVSKRLAEILWCSKSVAHLVPNVVTVTDQYEALLTGLLRGK
jgi:hypothetical protein